MDEGDGSVSQSGDSVVSYLGFMTLSAPARQSRLKTREGWEVIFPRTTKGTRWGEKVGTDIG